MGRCFLWLYRSWVVGLILSPVSTFVVFALPPDPKFESGQCGGIAKVGTRGDGKLLYGKTFCWSDTKEGSKGVFKPRVRYCQTCYEGEPGKFDSCKNKYFAEVVSNEPTGPTPPVPPTSGPVAPLQENGVLQTPDLGGTEPPTGDQGILPQDSILQQQQQQQQQQQPADQGAAELPPTTEETQPATAEEVQPVPVCQEGL